ncbi:unknown [Clostridium sp. CAG:510]|nr:unknown [Clostridium sp. CAG:510]
MGRYFQDLRLHQPYHHGRSSGKMAYRAVLQITSPYLPDRGGNQPPLPGGSFQTLSRRPGKGTQDGYYLRRTGTHGKTCHRCRLFRKRCCKTAYRNLKEPGIKRLLRNDAREVQQQDKRYHTEKIFTACQPAFGRLGNRAHRR